MMLDLLVLNTQSILSGRQSLCSTLSKSLKVGTCIELLPCDVLADYPFVFASDWIFCQIKWPKTVRASWMCFVLLCELLWTCLKIRQQKSHLVDKVYPVLRYYHFYGEILERRGVHFVVFFCNLVFYLSFHSTNRVAKAICRSDTFFISTARVSAVAVSPAAGWTWVVCICFNITIVLCFTLSLSLKNCRMAKASVTSLPSAPSEKLAGPTSPRPPPAPRATSTETTASRLSLHFMSRLALTTAKDKALSARWSPSTLLR